MSNKVYIIENKALAMAISYIIQEDFFTYDDRYNEGKKIYSFLKTEKFQKVLPILTNLRKEFN
jgi:hypothetical protein